uniref:Putative helicase n=1 Tax=viral metagenome TaxID=1070528 RepID=A0A6M3KI68_9ZZZZ
MELEKNYSEFLLEKEIKDFPSGFDVSVDQLNPMLFDWQALIVKWTIKRGRSAIFADCGLGKTPMQLVWAEQVSKFASGPVLILAPLAVAEQTKWEGDKFGINVNLCRSQRDVREGINITNYQKLHKFIPSYFCGIVLDESSIIKNFNSATKGAVIEAFYNTPYRLACTATPAPNDWMELGNHAEFLGVMTRTEMLSTFFINDTKDTGTWRLKGHVRDNYFWKWLSTWAIMLSSPKDLGFEEGDFKLPEITYHEHIIKSTAIPTRGFFNLVVTDLNDRRRVRRDTLEKRCKEAAELINATNELWVVWVNLNPEGELLTKLIDGAVEVAGRHTDEQKSQRMLDFAHGKVMRLVTKPSIAGHGMNWQVCARAAFVGLSDSWEQFYQATRRIWRFGQSHPVEVHIFIEEREGPVLINIRNKDRKARQMLEAMVQHTKELSKKKIFQLSRETDEYFPVEEMRLPIWLS